MKPPIAYYGGKQTLARRIVELMPAHRVYIEPFAGSMAVLFEKAPCTHEIVNDLDGAVVTFFRVLREQPDELARVCLLSPHARDEFAACANLDDPALSDLERARRFWVRINQSFGRAIGGEISGWSLTTAQNASLPNTIFNRLGRFREAALRLARVTIENCDAVGLVDRLATAPDCVVYADPTYLHSTRRSGRGKRASDYRFELADEDHRRLAESLNRTPATVILSGYPSPLYEELYAGWATVDFQVIGSSSNARTSTRSERTERLWINRPAVGLQETLQFEEVAP